MQKRGDVKRKREPALLHTVSTLALSVIATRCQLSQRERANPLRRSCASSPEGGASFALTNRWQKAPPEWNDFPPVGGRSRSQKGERLANAVNLRRFFPPRGCFRRKPARQMLFFSTTPPVKTQCRAVRRPPGIALFINNSSAEYAQSTTTTTAASGGNREELLGQRPARRKCRPRHDADAGCRNPIAERIPIVFLRTAPQPPDAPAKHTAMPRRTGSPP